MKELKKRIMDSDAFKTISPVLNSNTFKTACPLLMGCSAAFGARYFVQEDVIGLEHAMAGIAGGAVVKNIITCASEWGCKAAVRNALASASAAAIAIAAYGSLELGAMAALATSAGSMGIESLSKKNTERNL
ncbi:MAG: hypothetical protein FWE16_05115 [Firmicutes bacterium]|nr:hypothetical protein [Bacillota bacterium]